MNNLLNIIIDADSVEDLRHILEISEFVEFVLGDTLEKDLLWVLRRQVGKSLFYFMNCINKMSYVNAPVHDLLIRIKNAYMARKTTVDWVVFSKFKVNVLDLLKEYGFVKGYEVKDVDGKKFISIELKKVVDPINDIPSVKFFSKPSRPWYVGYKDLKAVAWGKWLGIISTNQGLLPVHVAKERKLWGELIAEIY